MDEDDYSEDEDEDDDEDDELDDDEDVRCVHLSTRGKTC
jgi:hypothetical protein